MMYRSKTKPNFESLTSTDIIAGVSPVSDLLTPERSYADIAKEWSVREAVGGMFREMKAGQQEDFEISLKEIPFLSDDQLIVLMEQVSKEAKRRGVL